MPRVVGRLRRIVTRRIEADVARLRSAGASVTFLAPGADDLEVMGMNLMNPQRRVEVLDTAKITAVARLREMASRPAGETR